MGQGGQESRAAEQPLWQAGFRRRAQFRVRQAGAVGHHRQAMCFPQSGAVDQGATHRLPARLQEINLYGAEVEVAEVG